MQALRSPDEIRDVNTRYHDVAAATYDSKWGIDFGDVARAQVLGKLHKLLPESGPGSFADALEIGCGTGYFGLNLLSTGIVERLTCTDISPGMVAALLENADRHGITGVEAVEAHAEALPFADESFDLVVGHAILHHIPDLERAFAEFHRVLRPGGRILFAGEPSRLGDRLAAIPKRAAVTLAPAWRSLIGAAAAPPPAEVNGSHAHVDHDLEGEVDIHAFRPEDLLRFVRGAGFEQVTVRGEELVANWFGWFNRGLEATADPDQVPMFWRQYAFRGYLLLQRLDAVALEPHLPPALFYNLLLTARKP